MKKSLVICLIFIMLVAIFQSTCVLAVEIVNDEEAQGKLKSSAIEIGGGGMLHSPAVSNFDENTVMVAADMGGLYVSNNTGEKWERKNLKGSVMTTYADPVREGVLYAGGSGVWRSTDNGKNFEMIFPREDDLIDRITLNENGLQYLFTRSKNYPTYKYIKNILVNPNNADNIFVLAYYGKEGFVYESTDNGENFTKLFEFKQENKDENLFYELTKLAYKKETNELYCIDDEEILKYDRAKNEAVSVYKSEKGIVDAVTVMDGDKTQFIIVENIEGMTNYKTRVYYTNDFENTTDLTENIIKDQPREFDYKEKHIVYDWSFTHIDATSLNNICLSHREWVTDYPYSTTAVLKYSNGTTKYLYGLPFRNHNNIKNRGWADGNIVSFGIAISRTNPNVVWQTTLTGVNYFPNDEDIYQRYTTPVKTDGETRHTTSGINEQSTYGVRIDPFDNNHILILNTDLGLISSYNNGQDWKQSNGQIPSAWVNTIYDAEFDKTKQNVVYGLWSGRHDAPYAPGNETDLSTVHGGFAISTDGGKTWNAEYSSGIPENTTPVKMGVVYPEDKSKDLTIYVATFKNGFYVSKDSGKTFTEINDGINKVSYKEGAEYQYILAADIEVKDGRVFGLTAKSTYNGATQKGEIFELKNNKWEKIDIAASEVGKNFTTPRDIYYHNGSLYISSTANTIWSYKDGKDFSNFAGGIFEYKNGTVTQIFDESISTTGVQIDSKGNLYVSDINGNIYRKAFDSDVYAKIYDSYHSISKGIQLIDDDLIYMAAFGGGILKLEGLKSLMPEVKLGDIDNDGEITINDLAKLKLHLIGKYKLNAEELTYADMDEDGKITINDLAKLKLIIINQKENTKEIAVESTKFDGLNLVQIVPENKKVTFERLNFQNEKQKKYGVYGAGSQWPVSLETSSNGDLMLYGIDVAGMYKSTDHGRTWTIANNGFANRGVGMFAIDPHNSNHVLALGFGTTQIAGIYVSYDKAETWQKDDDQVLTSHGARYLWDGLEFDPTSYDSSKNMSMVAFYSTPYMRDGDTRKSQTTAPESQTKLKPEQAGLYKTTDGGKTFNIIINDKKLADGIVRITEDGRVFVGNQYGLFEVDKVQNKIKASYLEHNPDEDYSKGITGLDVVGNTIYAQTWDGIYTLIDGSLTKITNENYKSENWPQFLTVSKSNPNHLIYEYRSDVNNYYVNRTATSFDGGKTWTEASIERDSTFYKPEWSAREKLYIIDPSDDNNVVTFGSDTLVRSSDGGKNFVQTSGISNMMQGGKFNFNYYDPDLIMFSAQDYTGVVSKDGGKTFEELKIDGKGNMYGGFAADRQTFFGFANPTWGGGTLTVTHNAGDTWTDTGLKATGVPSSTNYSSLQSPTDPNVLFAVEYYSKDNGYTWNKMNGCVCVFTFNYTGQKELYGANEKGQAVVSYDNGDSWQVISNEHWNNSTRVKTEKIVDMAYDHTNNFVYAVVEIVAHYFEGSENTYTVEKIYKLDVKNKTVKELNIPRDDDRGYMRERTVAVDPNSTNVVYVGGNGGYYSSATALLRSIDGGENWSILTTSNTEKFPSIAVNQGGYEVVNARVNPYDGRVWIACGCYGYETFDPPYDSSLVKHNKPQEHTIKYVYNNKVVNEAKVLNNERHQYIYDEDGLTLENWYTDKEFKNSFPVGSKVYDSMVLYAKMEEAIKVKFYDRNTFLREMDLDAYDAGDEKQIPVREGYAFAGWYADKNLTKLADFKEIKANTSVYAGWYEIEKDVFDINAKDMGNYIAYTDHRIQNGLDVENDASVDNRCIHMSVESGSIYYISFRMDTRCRIGLGKNKFWQYNAVKEYFIDEEDNNGRVPANKYVFKTVSSGEYNKLLVYYYTESGTKEYMDIKNTFKIYKIKNTNVQENNN